MASEDFDRFVERVNGPLVVVTVQVGEERGGCLVGFHVQASIEPELYALWLSRENRTTELAGRAEHLGVHYLERTQHDVAEHWGSLTGHETDKFSTVEWDTGPHGVPFLAASVDRLVLERVDVIEIPPSDHVCWLGRVVYAHIDPRVGEPFRLADAEDISAGNEATSS